MVSPWVAGALKGLEKGLAARELQKQKEQANALKALQLKATLDTAKAKKKKADADAELKKIQNDAITSLFNKELNEATEVGRQAGSSTYKKKYKQYTSAADYMGTRVPETGKDEQQAERTIAKQAYVEGLFAAKSAKENIEDIKNQRKMALAFPEKFATSMFKEKKVIDPRKYIPKTLIPYLPTLETLAERGQGQYTKQDLEKAQKQFASNKQEEIKQKYQTTYNEIVRQLKDAGYKDPKLIAKLATKNASVIIQSDSLKLRNEIAKQQKSLQDKKFLFEKEKQTKLDEMKRKALSLKERQFLFKTKTQKQKDIFTKQRLDYKRMDLLRKQKRLDEYLKQNERKNATDHRVFFNKDELFQLRKVMPEGWNPVGGVDPTTDQGLAARNAAKSDKLAEQLELAYKKKMKLREAGIQGIIDSRGVGRKKAAEIYDKDTYVYHDPVGMQLYVYNKGSGTFERPTRALSSAEMGEVRNKNFTALGDILKKTTNPKSKRSDDFSGIKIHKDDDGTVAFSLRHGYWGLIAKGKEIVADVGGQGFPRLVDTNMVIAKNRVRSLMARIIQLSVTSKGGLRLWTSASNVKYFKDMYEKLDDRNIWNSAGAAQAQLIALKQELTRKYINEKTIAKAIANGLMPNTIIRQTVDGRSVSIDRRKLAGMRVEDLSDIIRFIGKPEDIEIRDLNLNINTVKKYLSGATIELKNVVSDFFNPKSESGTDINDAHQYKVQIFKGGPYKGKWMIIRKSEDTANKNVFIWNAIREATPEEIKTGVVNLKKRKK